MGNLFSTQRPSSDSSINEEIQKLREEAAKQKEITNKAIQEVTQLAEEQYERQIEQSDKSIEEISSVIQRARDLRNEIAATNVQSSVLICAIYFNYPFGTQLSNKLNDNTQWSSNAELIVKMSVNENVFNRLKRIPYLLPIIWPTGEGDEAFHTYSSVSTNLDEPPKNYNIEVENNIINYIENTLPTRISNIFKFNTSTSDIIDEDEKKKLYDDCAKYISKIENDDVNTWYTDTLDFISKHSDIKQKWRSFATKTGKGVCANTIKILPSLYPKINSKFELYNALIITTNCIFSNYGQCMTSDGNIIKVEDGSTILPIGAVKGGQCFELNESWISKSNDLAFPSNELWDGNTFRWVSAQNEVSIKDITGLEKDSTAEVIAGDIKYTYPKWLTMTEICEKLKIDSYSVNEPGKGELKFVNPTYEYSATFLNDFGYIDLPFKMPRMGAAIYDTMKNALPAKLFMNLTTISANEMYNPSATDNASVLTFTDDVYCTPPQIGIQQDKNSSPISIFLYKAIINDGCSWSISIPLDTCQTMSKINSVILNDLKGTEEMLPQYIWTRNNFDTVKDNEGELAEIGKFNYRTTRSVISNDNIKYITKEELKNEYIKSGDEIPIALKS